jgi:hypothetical protein
MKYIYVFYLLLHVLCIMIMKNENNNSNRIFVKKLDVLLIRFFEAKCGTAKIKSFDLEFKMTNEAKLALHDLFLASNRLRPWIPLLGPLSLVH